MAMACSQRCGVCPARALTTSACRLLSRSCMHLVTTEA